MAGVSPAFNHRLPATESQGRTARTRVAGGSGIDDTLAAMKQPWRTTALVLFVAATLGGGLVGDRLLAVPEAQRDNLRLLTELLQQAHDHSVDDITYRDLVYGSIQGMLRALDPHTSFLSPEAFDKMRERQAASFFGLGILVSMRNGQLTVISPLEGTPAWRLGVRAGDIISTIEGDPTDSMSLDDAVSLLKGPRDTQVHIEIVRRGLDEPLPLTITRAEIPQNTVRYAYMLEPGTGYLRLTDFSRSTASEMKEAITKLQGEGMERLILDLRANGGGLLDQVVEVANEFIPPKSRIIETRGRTRDSHQAFFAHDESNNAIDIPVVVLVNNGTASAAEILAGAIQDHDVGLVVGTPTWGKGLVQTVYNLSYGAGIALTTAKYYTPSGRLIQRDYSSFFDYYTHFDHAADSSDPAPKVALEGQPTFHTDLGREVYGGGGITPDVVVDLPKLPTTLQYLYSRNAFFDFAIEWSSAHEIKDASWKPPADMLPAFRKWLIGQDLIGADEIDERFSDPETQAIALRQIHSDIMSSAFGTEAAHRVLVQGDLQIKKALSLFPRAVEMLVARRALDSDAAPGIDRPDKRTVGAVDGLQQP